MLSQALENLQKRIGVNETTIRCDRGLQLVEGRQMGNKRYIMNFFFTRLHQLTSLIHLIATLVAMINSEPTLC